LEHASLGEEALQQKALHATFPEATSINSGRIGFQPFKREFVIFLIELR